MADVRASHRSGHDAALDRLFHALADATRRRLLAQLALGPAGVTDLARPHRMSLPAVSKHVRILEAAGLVSRTVDGRVHRMSLAAQPLEQVEVWLDPFRSYWEQTLRSLERDLAARRIPVSRGGPRSRPAPARRRRRPERPLP